MEETIKDRWWIYLGAWRDLLFRLFFFFMPFTQALTFNLGFPLKFSEMALLMLSALYLLFNRRIPMTRSLIWVLASLFMAVTISELYNLYRPFPYLLREFTTRFGYAGDSISRYVYFILALLAFFISTDAFLTDKQRYAKAWLAGAVVAASYSMYLTLFSALRWPVYLLPGMQNPPQTIDGVIIRCGTFLEGNMMGLYLILSAALAFYVKRFKTGFFLFFSSFSTISTLTILSIFVFLLIFFQRIIFRRKYLSYILPGLALLGLVIFLFTRTSLYRSYVYNKLFASTEHINDVSAYSKTDRLYSIHDAWRMGASNPLLGVGLANYARHYDHFADQAGFDPTFVRILSRTGQRVIPNNIYLEIWAECGAIALCIFLFLLGLLVVYSLSDRSKALFPAMVCLLICFIAYPSFIMIYLWSFMGLIAADRIATKKHLQQAQPLP